MTLIANPPPPPSLAPVSIADIRAWLRMGSDQDDIIIAGLLAAATELCESYIGQYLITRVIDEDISARAGRLYLRKKSVQEVVAVSQVTRQPDSTPDSIMLAVGDWSPFIHADGGGEVTLHRAISSVRAPTPTQVPTQVSTRYRVRYRVGMAQDAEDIPESLRQGIIRMVAHLHQSRDKVGNNPPPTVVTLLWQPWRRVGLGARHVRNSAAAMVRSIAPAPIGPPAGDQGDQGDQPASGQTSEGQGQ